MSSPRRNHNSTHCPFVNDCGSQLQPLSQPLFKDIPTDNRRAPTAAPKAAFISLSFHLRSSCFLRPQTFSLPPQTPRRASAAPSISLLPPPQSAQTATHRPTFRRPSFRYSLSAYADIGPTRSAILAISFYPSLSAGLTARDGYRQSMRSRIEPVNALAKRFIRIYNTLDTETGATDMIVPNHIISVSGHDIIVDTSKSDEGFWLEKRDGRDYALRRIGHSITVP